MAGPANCAAAVPVSTKMPAPMMAPMPSSTRLLAVSARFRLCSPSSGVRSAIDLVRKRLMRVKSW